MCSATFGAETVSCMGGLCKLDLIVVVGKASLIGNGFAISLFIAVPISDGVVLQMLV